MTTEDYFLKISGIKGEARHGTHRGEIDVDSWSWGLTKQAAKNPGRLQERLILPQRTMCGQLSQRRTISPSWRVTPSVYIRATPDLTRRKGKSPISRQMR